MKTDNLSILDDKSVQKEACKRFKTNINQFDNQKSHSNYFVREIKSPPGNHLLLAFNFLRFWRELGNSEPYE